MDTELLRSLATPNQTKILLCVADGLGGLPHPETRRTELETASIPNLDRMAGDSLCGLTLPVGYGITPGSGPGHLALFGYDPLRYEVGRGVLEALGIDFDLQPIDVAARGNFCTLDEAGLIKDRRAGRLATEECVAACEKLRSISLTGVEVLVEPVREYRWLLVLRGEGLDDHLTQTDPEREGVAPLPVRATAPQAERTASLVNQFIARAREVLADEPKANGILLRGFAKHPSFPSLPEVTGMRAGAFAVYPMYRGLARLAGMAPLPTGPSVAEEFAALEGHWPAHDFLFLHVKKTDSTGEDGDFDAKVAAIEEVDAQIPRALALRPDVLVVTGDHSTPAVLRSHSWHPVPFLLCAATGRPDAVQQFCERTCSQGQYGRLPGKNLLPLMLAHAGRLTKFGA